MSTSPPHILNLWDKRWAGQKRAPEQELQKQRGPHAGPLKQFRIVQPGLSDPKTSQRSVESWCNDGARALDIPGLGLVVVVASIVYT